MRPTGTRLDSNRLPPGAHGRRIDTKRWGNKETVSAASQGINAPLDMATSGMLVDAAMWPPRLWGLFVAFTPADQRQWTADGGNFNLIFEVYTGLGQSIAPIPIVLAFNPPYSPIFGVPNTPTLIIPARRLMVSAQIAGKTALNVGAKYEGTFYAVAAPYSLEGLGGDGGPDAAYEGGATG